MFIKAPRCHRTGGRVTGRHTHPGRPRRATSPTLCEKGRFRNKRWKIQRMRPASAQRYPCSRQKRLSSAGNQPWMIAMAEPLKNLLHPALVKTMADQIGAHSTGFDTQRFTDLATEDMQQLELMQRAIQIRDALAATLPQDFEQAAALLSASLPKDGRSGMTGWALLPVSQFVAQKGLGHFDLSAQPAQAAHAAFHRRVRHPAFHSCRAGQGAGHDRHLDPGRQPSCPPGWQARAPARACPGQSACPR